MDSSGIISGRDCKRAPIDGAFLSEQRDHLPKQVAGTRSPCSNKKAPSQTLNFSLKQENCKGYQSVDKSLAAIVTTKNVKFQ
jgi:hypothetical protein